MPLCPTWPWSGCAEGCCQLRALHSWRSEWFGGGGWTWGSPLNGNTEANGHGYYLQRVGGLSNLSDSLCRGWDNPTGLPATGSVGWEGPPGVRRVLRVSGSSQEECSSEQQVEVAAEKGSSPGHHTAAGLRGDGTDGPGQGDKGQARRLRVGTVQNIGPEQDRNMQACSGWEWPPGT